MDNREVQLVGPLVASGVLPPGEANECLVRWQKLVQAGKQASLLGVMVKAGLMTKTQALVLAGAPLERTQPFEQYRLLREVGRGGMAVVYEGTYVPLDTRVAVKILLTEFGLQERYRLRFRREAQLLLNMDHPNIVEGREYASHDEVDFYAMGFVDGISVEEILDSDGSLDEGMALHVACQVGEALEHMTQKGVVHRDIKPANFVLDHDGTVRIIDFGLAKLMQGMREDTAEDTTVGTLEYMSPEQCRGLGAVDIRADLYSLGASLFHMATGQLPFQGSREEIMYGHVKRDLAFTDEQRARVSPQVQFVIRKMMAKAPEDRYATPADFVADLRAVAGDLIDARGPVPAVVGQTGIEAAPIPTGPQVPKPVIQPRPRREPGARPGLRPTGGRRGKRPGRGRR